MWKNLVQPDRPKKKIGHMRIAFRIPRATNTHSEYVILIAFPLQQWLHESASVLCHTYIASPVLYSCWGVRISYRVLLWAYCISAGLYVVYGWTRNISGMIIERTINISGMIIEKKNRIVLRKTFQRHFVHHKYHMNRSGISYVLTDWYLRVVWPCIFLMK